MRHNNSGRRQRGRNNGGNRKSVNRMQVFDSNGPEVRIRGTAHQICDKYMALAKDALAAGNNVLAESYHQHAEHYQRIINSWEEEASKSDNAYTNDSKEEDLSLPSSILGEKDEVNSEDKTCTSTDTSEEIKADSGKELAEA